MAHVDESHFEITLYCDDWDIRPTRTIPEGVVIEVHDYRMAGPDCEPGTTEQDAEGRHFFRLRFDHEGQ